jgi:hypothetical protein
VPELEQEEVPWQEHDRVQLKHGTEHPEVSGRDRGGKVKTDKTNIFDRSVKELVDRSAIMMPREQVSLATKTKNVEEQMDMAMMEVPEEGAKMANFEQKEPVAKQIASVKEGKMLMNKEAKVRKEVKRLEESSLKKKEFSGKAQEDLINSPRLIKKPGRRIYNKKNDSLVQQRISHFLTIKGEQFIDGVGQRVGGPGMLVDKSDERRKRRLSGRPNTPDKRTKIGESPENSLTDLL